MKIKVELKRNVIINSEFTEKGSKFLVDQECLMTNGDLLIYDVELTQSDYLIIWKEN